MSPQQWLSGTIYNLAQGWEGERSTVVQSISQVISIDILRHHNLLLKIVHFYSPLLDLLESYFYGSFGTFC